MLGSLMDKRIALQHAALFWRDNMARGLLSVVGIVIGITGLVVAAAIDRGAQAELMEVARNSGTGLVQASTDGRFPSAITAQLTDALYPDVRGAAAYTTSDQTVAYRNRSLSVQINAVQAEYQRTRLLNVAEGRFIAAYDLERDVRVAVVNEALAHALLPFASKLNSEVLIDGAWYQVIGVAADGLGEPTAYIPLQANHPQHVLIGFISEAAMRANLKRLQRALEVRASGALTPVELVVPLDAIREQQQVRRLVGIVLTVFAVLVLGLGGLGVANVMLLNVLTRKPEIALRRALGARARDIVLQFSAETSVVCAVGGLIALLCAPLCALVLMSLLGWSLRFDLYVLLVALAATALVAAGASVVPARKAAVVPPAQGLA